jgi:hypothetical protein
MQVSFLRRLVKEDFPQQYKDVVGKIGSILNPALEQISLCLHNNITWTDNFAATVINIAVTVDANGIPTNPTTFLSKLPSQTLHCFVTRALSASNPGGSFVTSAPFVDFVDNNGTVTVSHVTGLPANTTFNLTMIVTI